MKKVCIDTCILIYWLDSNADPNLKAKAQQLIEDLQGKNYEIILPAPVLGEYLTGVSSEDREEHINLLSEIFFIASYDKDAALINANLWENKKEIIKELLSKGHSRQVVKVDAQIISIAVVSGCEVLYTNDEKIQKLGEDFIKIELIEKLTTPIQSALFKKF